MAENHLKRFQHYLTTQTALSPRTIQLYLSTARRFFAEYADITVENANTFIVKSTATKKSYFITSVMKHIFISDGKVNESDTLVKIKKKPAEPKAVYMKQEELQRIVTSMPTLRHRMVATVQYCTGARAADVLSIQKGNWKLKSYELEIKLTVKGGGERTIIIPKSYTKLLKNYIDGVKRMYPFLIGWSGSIEKTVDSAYHSYWKELKAVAKHLGHADFTTHDFRRNFIDDAYTAVKDIRAVSKAAGHAHLATTLRYLDKREKVEQTKEIIRKVRA